jgi:hypothetical protein
MLFEKVGLNWRHTLGELAIVVAGVFIALSADGWAQQRADRALERGYISDLGTDLRSDTAQLSIAIALAESRAALGHAVLRAIDGDTVLAPGDLVVALERQFYFAFPAYSRTTMSDLLSTGNLRLLRDRALKRQLSEYYQTIDRLEQWSENWRVVQRDVERLMPELLPLRLREAVIRPTAPSAGWNETWGPSPWAPAFSVSDAEGREILARLRAHPEVRPRIEGMVRVQGNQYGVLTVIRKRAMETLAVVEGASSKP